MRRHRPSSDDCSNCDNAVTPEDSEGSSDGCLVEPCVPVDVGRVLVDCTSLLRAPIVALKIGLMDILLPAATATKHSSAKATRKEIDSTVNRKLLLFTIYTPGPSMMRVQLFHPLV